MNAVVNRPYRSEEALKGLLDAARLLTEGGMTLEALAGFQAFRIASLKFDQNLVEQEALCDEGERSQRLLEDADELACLRIEEDTREREERRREQDELFERLSRHSTEDFILGRDLLRYF